MNLQKVNEILSKQNLKEALYFVRKKKEEYVSFSPEIDPRIFQSLKRYIRENIEEYYDTEQVEYSPTGHRDSTIEVCDIEYVGNYEEVVQGLDAGNVEDIEEEADNFSFYCIQISDDEENEVLILRRVTKFKRLYSKGFLAVFKANQLNKIDNKVLGMDGTVDLIIFENEIVIFNYIALERIFRLNEQFSSKAQTAMNLIRTSNKIIGMDSFEEDCLNSLKYQRVLTKMLKEENELDKCFDNFENIRETIDIFDLDIEIQESPNEGIIYESKEQIMDILRLARDSYYKSIIREEFGIDDKV